MKIKIDLYSIQMLVIIATTSLKEVEYLYFIVMFNHPRCYLTLNNTIRWIRMLRSVCFMFLKIIIENSI